MDEEKAKDIEKQEDAGKPAAKEEIKEEPKAEKKAEEKPAAKEEAKEEPKAEKKAEEKPAAKEEAKVEDKGQTTKEEAANTEAGESKGKKRKKINLMSQKDIDAKLKSVSENMGNLKSQYAKQLLKQKDILNQ